MHDAGRRYLTLVVVLAAALTVATAPLVGATTPGPVISVEEDDPEGPPPPETWKQELPPIIPPDEAEPDEGSDDSQQENQLDCFVGGPRPLAAVARGTTGLPAMLAGYPGPVIAVGPAPARWRSAEPPCTTDLRLSLKVESPKNEKPDGANATVDGRWLVPRRRLEAGVRSEMPAERRTVNLDEPGEEWELKAVACTCQGQASSVALNAVGMSGPPSIGLVAAYPGPVVAVQSSGRPGVEPGSTGCSGASASSASAVLAIAPGGTAASGQITSYPAPVIAVENPESEAEPPEPTPEPTPPTREPGSISWDSDGTVVIADPEQAGAIVDCTWTVEHVFGWVTVRNVTKPTGAEDTIHYRAVPTAVEGGERPYRFAGSASGTRQLLRQGGWSLEPVRVQDGWEFVESKCQESDSGKRTSAEGPSAQLGVDVGDEVTCTFRWKLLTPKEGRWRAVNKPGTTSCTGKGGSVTVKLRKESGNGRLAHRREGDRLVMTGRGQGLIPVKVDRDPDDPRFYRGSTTRTFSGAKGKFNFVYRVVNEKKMTGSLVTTWKQGGNKCASTRKVVLTYVGK